MTAPKSERRLSHYHADMLSVEDALARILAQFAPLGPEKRPVLEALGQTLADDVVAGLDIPPLPNAQMDGYAVRRADVASATPEHPVALRVVGYVAAGSMPSVAVSKGTAVRIMTGAPVPQGADAVVPFEDTDEVERKGAAASLTGIGVRIAPGQGTNVRPAGEDVRRGDVVLTKGTVLRPGELGVLASLGFTHISVVRRPTIAILATGDELTPPGEVLGPGKIYDSNSYSVAAGVAKYGGIPKLLGIARDTLEDLHHHVDVGLTSDLLITSAGVSKGDYDIVKDVLAERGEVGFWSVRMRPAKPLAFGVLRAPGGRLVPHLGLPGNPVSAMVAFEQFARPAILKMLGRTRLAKPTVQAVLEGAIDNTDGRRVYARVEVMRRDGKYHARIAGGQRSNLLTSMARANGLAICPEDLAGLRAGEVATVQMLDWNEEME